MVIITLQQIVDERISFLKEQINSANRAEVNQTFQLQIEAIRSVDDYTKDKVEAIIKQKKAQLKNSKDVHESIGCLRSLTPQYHCLTEIGLSNPLASESKNPYLCSEYISTAAKCLF